MLFLVYDRLDRMKPLIDSLNGGMGAVVVDRCPARERFGGRTTLDLALVISRSFPQTDGVEQQCVNAKKDIGTLCELRLF
eukprot:scaffold174504_cov63-Attheya_sp.AAC.10